MNDYEVCTELWTDFADILAHPQIFSKVTHHWVHFADSDEGLHSIIDTSPQ